MKREKKDGWRMADVIKTCPGRAGFSPPAFFENSGRQAEARPARIGPLSRASSSAISHFRDNFLTEGAMSQRILIGTRKGLFTVERTASGWDVTGASFLGDNVPMLLTDPRDGAVYAALDHGHFGTKLHRSADGGSTWEEVGVPVYPEPGPGDETPGGFGGKPIPWKLEKIWR